MREGRGREANREENEQRKGMLPERGGKEERRMGSNSNENKIHFGDQTYNCTGYPLVPVPVPGYCYFLVQYQVHGKL
jgi:hypothetical protein